MAIVIWKPAVAGAITLCCMGVAHAETERSGFYSIVGPDGQMIIIDRNASKKDEKKNDSRPKAALGSKWSLFSRNKKANVSDQSASAIASLQSAKPPVVETNDLPDKAGVLTDPVALAESTPGNSKSVNQNIVNQKAVNQEAVSQRPSAQPFQQKSVNDQKAEQVALSQIRTTAQIEGRQVQDPVRNEQPITVIDGEQYIDSEYLEQREFNLEGKKRFYNLPDGLGGSEVLEREKGVDMTVFRKQKIDKPQVVDLSKNYQRIPQEQIIALTGTACFSEKQLKSAKLFKQDEYLDFWPKPGFEPKFDFVVAKLEQPINDIQVTSYANNMGNPKFYWPLPIFLNDQGCVLEGVNAFYQTTLAPTVTMHQAIQGYLHIPDNTRYILFTPLEAAADLSETQLTNKGQVRLTPIR
jgi:hypothetical protein